MILIITVDQKYCFCCFCSGLEMSDEEEKKKNTGKHN